MPKKHRFFKAVLQFHRWIGLLSGLVLFIVALTGAIYCWAPEMRRVAYKQSVESSAKDFASVDELRRSALEALPAGDFRTVFFRGRERTAEVLIYAPGTYYIAQLNPYTAELVHLQDMNTGVIQFIVEVHRSLGMGDVGSEIIHWSTATYLLLWGSGLAIRRVGRRRGLRRWHDKAGYYGSFIALLAVATGLFWGFEAIKSGAKYLTNEYEKEYDIPVSALPNGMEKPSWGAGGIDVMEQVAREFRSEYPERYVRIGSPHQWDEAVQVTLVDPSMTVRSSDHFYFDRYSGELLSGRFHPGRRTEASAYHAIEESVYDWHMGTWLGFPGRLAMCLSSLAVAWLPMSGVLIWRRRRHARSQPTVKSEE